MKLKRIGIACLALLACVSLAACSGTTVAAYINAIGVSVNAIIAAELPNWPGGPALQALFATAATDAANWKAGTKSQEFEIVLNDLAAAVDSVPLSPAIDEYIGLAVAGIDSILAITTAEDKAHTIGEQAAVFYGWLSTDTASTPQRKHVWKGPQPKTLKQYNQQLKKLQASKKK